MKIVFLDVKTIGEDIDLSGFDRLGEVVKYDFSTSEEVTERVQDADVIILNKVQVNEQTIGKAEKLKLVCVTATGTNNLDKEYLEKRGVAWRNVAGYSTETVAQHTFAMLLYLLEKIRYYDDYVKEERYINDTIFTHFAEHFTEISGKTWGIIGLGTIDIAKAFGAQIIYYSASGRPAQEGYEQVDLDTLLAKSDIISVHTPLTSKTRNLINRDRIAMMKPNAIFINVSRGGVADEAALTEAIEQKRLGGLGIDVYTEEPFSETHPYNRILSYPNTCFTPHNAWGAYESRLRCLSATADNIKAYLRGESTNRVV